MDRAQGMEERIIPSSCPNISFHSSPPYFFFFSFCSLDFLDVFQACWCVLSAHACSHTEMQLHVSNMTYVVTEIQPALWALSSTDPSPFLGWSTGLCESSLFPIRTQDKKQKKKKRFEVRLRLSLVALLDLRSRHTASSSTKNVAGFHEPTYSSS